MLWMSSHATYLEGKRNVRHGNAPVVKYGGIVSLQAKCGFILGTCLQQMAHGAVNH